jgi:hypothetical protein
MTVASSTVTRSSFSFHGPVTDTVRNWTLYLKGSPLKSRKVLPSIGLLVVFVTMLACAEQEITTAPKPTLAQPRMASLESFEDFLGAEGGDTLALPPYAAYPEGIKAVLTVSGKILVVSDPDRSDYFGTDSVNVGPGGIWIDGGYGYCAVGVTIAFGGMVYGPPPCVPYDSSGTWSITAVVTGNGKAGRNPGIPSYHPGPCDAPPDCHTYTGQQTITVVPLVGDLDLQAHYELQNKTVRKALFIHPFINSDTYAHQMVDFTDSTTPRGLPIKPLLNTWTMTDPDAPLGYWQHTQATAYCNMTNPNVVCPIDVRETGIFRTTARVNGVEHTDDVTVYCAESEPLLNNDLIRQQLMEALIDSSKVTATDPRDINERTFFIVQDTTNPAAMPQLIIFPKGDSADACNGTPIMPTPAAVPANMRILAWGHTHPFEASDSNVVNRLTVCRNPAGQLDGFEGLEGGSAEDRATANAYNDPARNSGAASAGWLPMPGFIIDLHNVYILRPGQNSGNELTAGNKFSWDGVYPNPGDSRYLRRCGWPKRTIQ